MVVRRQASNSALDTPDEVAGPGKTKLEGGGCCVVS